MVKTILVEGIEQFAITGDWFSDNEGIMKLHGAVKDVLEQCLTNQEAKENVHAESVFYVLRLIEALENNESKQ